MKQIALLALGELAEFDSKEAVEAALEAVESALPALRYQGLVTLSSLKRADALDDLLSKTTDDDPEVRWVAVRLIDELCFPHEARSTDPPLLDGPNVTYANKLLPLMQDQVPRVAVAATLLLCRLGDVSAINKLPAWLSPAPYKLEPQDEAAAIDLVGQLGLASAKAQLQRRAWRRLWEGPMTWSARVALAQLGDARARQAILQSLYSNSPLKCARAIEAVGRIGLKEGKARLEFLLANPASYDVETIRSALQRLDPPREPHTP